MMSSADAGPSWEGIAENLTQAIVIARDAYKKTRRRRPKILPSEIKHIQRCEQEIARFIRHARQAIDQSPSELAPDETTWRRIVLDLFRANSLAWEVLWITYEGIPQVECGSGLGPAGEELTTYIVDAISALSTGEGEGLLSVDWNGRPQYRER